MPNTVGEESRRLYEQIGALYEVIQTAEPRTIELASDDETPGVQAFGDFLDTVRKVARAAAMGAVGGDGALALYDAVRRYERDRTGEAPARGRS